MRHSSIVNDAELWIGLLSPRSKLHVLESWTRIIWYLLHAVIDFRTRARPKGAVVHQSELCEDEVLNSDPLGSHCDLIAVHCVLGWIRQRCLSWLQ